MALRLKGTSSWGVFYGPIRTNIGLLGGDPPLSLEYDYPAPVVCGSRSPGVAGTYEFQTRMEAELRKGEYGDTTAIAEDIVTCDFTP